VKGSSNLSEEKKVSPSSSSSDERHNEKENHCQFPKIVNLQRSFLLVLHQISGRGNGLSC
jgi:hypothetical protein